MSGSGPVTRPDGPESRGSARNRLWLKGLCAGAAVIAVGMAAFFASSMNEGASEADTVPPEAASATVAPGLSPRPSIEPTEPAIEADEPDEGQNTPAEEAAVSAAEAEPASDAALATQERETAPAVPVVDGVAVSNLAEARVTAMEAVDGEARGIGEIAGPAVRFTVSFTNNSGEPIDLGSAAVMVEAGDERLPANELSGPGAEPFPLTVGPGETVTGAFVFLIPVESRDQVFMYLNYSVDVPMAAFSGSVPNP